MKKIILLIMTIATMAMSASATKIYVCGTKITGRDNAKQLIEDNPELAEELTAKIFEAMKNPPMKKR